MKVTLIQMNIEWAMPEANRAEASRLMDEAQGSDLYVLPEMFDTGFITEKPENLEYLENQGKNNHSTTLSYLLAQARQRNAAICGSISTKDEDGTFRNRLYFVRPDGEVSFYDKHHLFTYGGEDKHYKPGNHRLIVEWRGVRILPLVCYDLRFPVWSRNNAPKSEDGKHYDLCLYVASWPSSRQEVWNTLLRARAIENQCYIAGVNRIGNDPACQYTGGTQAIDAYGRIVSACPDNKPSTITLDLDMQRLQQFRDKFPVLNDAD